MAEIVVGIDGSAASLRAVEWAAREAALHKAPLLVVSVPVLPPRMSHVPDGRQAVAGLVSEAARQALATAAERAAELEPGLAIETRLLSGPPANVLTDVAARASMLVVGSRGVGGFTAMTLGSVSRYVATHSPVPVVVAREENMAVHREIVAGVRDPGGSGAVLEFAFREAALRKARLLAVHASFWSLPATSRAKLASALAAELAADRSSGELSARMEEDLAAWRGKYPGVQAGWEITHASPGRVLVGASARADLVVLGTRRRGGTGVGSVIHSVLGHAHSPVACVPASG